MLTSKFNELKVRVHRRSTVLTFKNNKETLKCVYNNNNNKTSATA